MSLLNIVVVSASSTQLFIVLRYLNWRSLWINYSEKSISILITSSLLLKILSCLWDLPAISFIRKFLQVYSEQFVLAKFIHRNIAPTYYIFSELYLITINSYIGMMLSLFLIFNTASFKNYFALLLFSCRILSVVMVVFSILSSVILNTKTFVIKIRENDKTRNNAWLTLTYITIVLVSKIFEESKDSIVFVLLDEFLFTGIVCFFLTRKIINRRRLAGGRQVEDSRNVIASNLN